MTTFIKTGLVFADSAGIINSLGNEDQFFILSLKLFENKRIPVTF